jgi:dihydrofolate reductase
MKTILYLGETINGYMARTNGDAPWSRELFATYYSNVKKAGNLIVGKKTYEIIEKEGEIKKCGYPFTVIVTKTRKPISNINIATVNSPLAAIKILKSKGFKELIVGGGSKLATSFMEQGLIDEIWLDLEPLIFGHGIPLLQNTKLEVKLRLIKTIKLSKNTLQLRYKVLK